jgi:hypothetical protein
MSSPEKMREFLVAAMKAADGHGRVFRIEDAFGWLEQWDRTDCDRLAALLEKDGLLNRLPNGEAILTTAGFNAASEL